MADKVAHFEVHGRDGGRLREFYASLFRWKIAFDQHATRYGLVNPEAGGIGGVIAQSPAAPLVTVYVEVPDLYEALGRVEILGGTILMEPDQVRGGRQIARFADPDGNTIGLIKAGRS